LRKSLQAWQLLSEGMTSSPRTPPNSSKPLFEVNTAVAAVHELEEEHGARMGERRAADLIDDQQRST
jgi:hypothetical protein